jgi:hypothetical protein
VRQVVSFARAWNQSTTCTDAVSECDGIDNNGGVDVGIAAVVVQVSSSWLINDTNNWLGCETFTKRTALVLGTYHSATAVS